jgi:hypothetical protein
MTANPPQTLSHVLRRHLVGALRRATKDVRSKVPDVGFSRPTRVGSNEPAGSTDSGALGSLRDGSLLGSGKPREKSGALEAAMVAAKGRALRAVSDADGGGLSLGGAAGGKGGGLAWDERSAFGTPGTMGGGRPCTGVAGRKGIRPCVDAVATFSPAAGCGTATGGGAPAPGLGTAGANPTNVRDILGGPGVGPCAGLGRVLLLADI